MNENAARYVSNTGILINIEMDARVELVAAARLAQIAMAECFHDDGDHVDDWEGLRAASERLYDALRPYADILGVDELPLPDC